MLCSGTFYSQQAIFYPLEAERRGATPSQYGGVFGMLMLAEFIFCKYLPTDKISEIGNCQVRYLLVKPLWKSDKSIFILRSAPLVGKYLPVVGVKLTYPLGAVTMALSFASFGCLYWVEDVNLFLTASYVLRCPPLLWD